MAALRRQSDDHWRFALQANARGRPSYSAASSAYQAGYCALLTALSAEETKSLADHPSSAATSLAAGRLQLCQADHALGERGAAGYYAPSPAVFSSFDEWFTWARRVRQAAGWDE